VVHGRYKGDLSLLSKPGRASPVNMPSSGSPGLHSQSVVFLGAV